MLGTTGTSHHCRTTKNTTVQCLLDHGADAKLEGDNYQVPLSDAADKGHRGIVRVLPEHDADANSQDKDGLYTAFLHGVYYGNSKADFPQTARLLVLERGARPPNASNTIIGSSAVFPARSCMHLSAHCTDVDTENKKRISPLPVQGALACSSLIRSGRVRNNKYKWVVYQ